MPVRQMAILRRVLAERRELRSNVKSWSGNSYGGIYHDSVLESHASDGKGLEEFRDLGVLFRGSAGWRLLSWCKVANAFGGLILD